MGSDKKKSQEKKSLLSLEKNQEKGSLERQKTFKHKEKLQPHAHLHQQRLRGETRLPPLLGFAEVPQSPTKMVPVREGKVGSQVVSRPP